MSDLSGKQRRWLRGEAHLLKAVVQLGARGLTDSVVAEVDTALEAHELIKVRLVGGRDEREAMAADLADRVEAQAVGLTGRVAILFRPHDDPERRRIRPPGS
jgi:RNA-binding protein